jgi:hypothetical protein
MRTLSGIGMIDLARHEGLRRLDGFAFPVLASVGVEPRARELAARTAQALSFLASALAVRPDMALLVLAPDDWDERSGFPLYGMPNYVAGNVVVAGEPSDFWRGFVDLVAEANPAGLEALSTAYGRCDEIDLSQFFDLLVIHEIGHHLHHVGNVHFPRLWLNELFCNLCLHVYVAEHEPGALAALECFPAVLAAVSPDRFPNRDLHTFEALYNRMPPQNYGWYECRLHVAAERVYDAGGTAALRGLWDRFRFSEADLGVALEEVEPQLASVLSDWPPAVSSRTRRYDTATVGDSQEVEP